MPALPPPCTEIEQLLSLPSGYHRDLQNSKGAIVRGFKRGLAALELLPALLSRLQWRPDTLRAAIDPGMYATDAAIEPQSPASPSVTPTRWPPKPLTPPPKTAPQKPASPHAAPRRCR